MTKRLLRPLAVLGLACSIAAFASAEDIKGILMDQASSGKADLRIVGTTLVGGRIVAEAHTKEELLKPENERSGYGVYTSDNKFLKFDQAGNRKALAAIKASTRLDDFEVEIEGEIKDDMIKVLTLRILPPTN